MQIVMDCFQDTIFNWSEDVVVNLKGQLTRVRTAKLKNFGYGAFVISFSFEKIPLLAPEVVVERGGPHDPWMLKWVTLMIRHGGGEGPTVRFTPNFFEWLENHIIMIKYFLYAGWTT